MTELPADQVNAFEVQAPVQCRSLWLTRVPIMHTPQVLSAIVSRQGSSTDCQVSPNSSGQARQGRVLQAWLV